MPLTLIPYAERGAWPYPELGAPCAIARDDTRGLVAIGWVDASLAHLARAVPATGMRVGVYDVRRGSCLGCFDRARFELNELAFHPARPELAIATGEYDGGYLFEGQLLVWNWETGAWHSELAAARDVQRAVWRADGTLAILVSPRDDGESPTTPRAFVLAPRAAGEGSGWAPRAPERPERDDPRLAEDRALAPADAGFADLDATAALAGERQALGLCPRPPIHDLAWLADGRLAIALGTGGVELWRPATQEVTTVTAVDVGHVTSLHVAPSGDLLAAGMRDFTTLYRVADDALVPLHRFARAHGLAMAADGRLLARHTPAERGAPTDDFLVAADGTVAARGDLGPGGTFDHALRVEGARDLYFLTGPYREKVLRAIAPDGAVRTVMAWDPPADGHAMYNVALAIDDRYLVRAYRGHVQRGADDCRVELCELATGKRIWRVARLPGVVVALAHWRAAGCVVASTTARRLVAIDLARGALVHDEPYLVGRTDTVVTAIAPQDDAIAFATIDGRVQIVARR